MFRVLSLNLALRPVDVAAGSSSSSSTGTETKTNESKEQKSGGMVAPECGCYPEYHVYNSNEVRVRGFVKWLMSIPNKSQPDILCFQELMWLPTTEYLSSQLEKLGYTTGINIDPLSPDNQGSTVQLSPTAKFKRAGSGLAIYYKDSKLTLLKSGKAMFDKRLGADYLCEKGYMWCVFRTSSPSAHIFAVLTLHPQAYVNIATQGPPCENPMVGKLRLMAVEQMKSLGGYPRCIEAVHMAQFAQIAQTVKELQQNETKNIIITGDYNVNSFLPEIDSKEEQNPKTATEGENNNREFKLVEGILQAQSVPSAQGQTFKLTWDPSINLFCRSLDPRQPSVYQKIDHTMTTKGSAFSYVDQQIVPLSFQQLSFQPFPELDLFWTDICGAIRAGSGPSLSYPNQLMKDRITQGMIQKQKALQSATSEQKNDPVQWALYIQSLPFEKSSQLWKGLEFYGFLTEATLTESKDFAIRQFQSLLTRYKIGDPHPFRMLAEVSDHAALITRFCF